MSYTSGTANNYQDLLAVLATYVSTHGWTILEQSSTKLCLKGSGSVGLDVYVGIEAFELSGNYYNWRCTGSRGYRNGISVLNQPLCSGPVYLYLWNSSIPYWIVVSGSRIILIAKISTTYHMLYLG